MNIVFLNLSLWLLANMSVCIPVLLEAHQYSPCPVKLLVYANVLQLATMPFTSYFTNIRLKNRHTEAFK